MRLHGLIFAAAHAVPFVPLNYDPKIASFAESQAIPALPLDVTPDTLVGVASDCWTAAEETRQERLRRAERLQAEAERNIRSLADICTGR